MSKGFGGFRWFHRRVYRRIQGGHKRPRTRHGEETRPLPEKKPREVEQFQRSRKRRRTTKSTLGEGEEKPTVVIGCREAV